MKLKIKSTIIPDIKDINGVVWPKEELIKAANKLKENVPLFCEYQGEACKLPNLSNCTHYVLDMDVLDDYIEFEMEIINEDLKRLIERKGEHKVNSVICAMANLHEDSNVTNIEIKNVGLKIND